MTTQSLKETIKVYASYARTKLNPWKALFSFGLLLYFIFVVWMIFTLKWLGVILLVADLILFAHLIMQRIIHKKFRPASSKVDKTLLAETLGKTVDVIVTCYDEPIELLKNTLEAAVNIKGVRDVFILDDGERTEVSGLLKGTLSKVKYFCRWKLEKAISRKRNKAGNLNSFFYSRKRDEHADFYLVLDVDQRAFDNIAQACLHQMQDPKVALVATEQSFDVTHDKFNHDTYFYHVMQCSSDHDECAISCGSGVMYRTTALIQIGGFADWNLVEDLTTSYELNVAGWKTKYLDFPLSQGIAPKTLPAIEKQRGMWALDTLRLFFKRVITKELPWSKDKHYFVMGFGYITSALVIPLLYIVSVISLAFNIGVIEHSTPMLIVKVVSMLAVFMYYWKLNNNSTLSARMWFGLWLCFFKALCKVGSDIPKYITTNGSGVKELKSYIGCVNAFMVAFACVLLPVSVALYGWTWVTTVNVVALSMITYWFLPVIRLQFKSK